MSLVDVALRRALESLSPEDLVAVATGDATLVVRRNTGTAPDPAQLGLLPEAAKAAGGRGGRRQPLASVPQRAHRGQGRPARRRAAAASTAAPVDVVAAAARIDTLPTPAAVEEYLQDPRFTVPVLRKIARALGPTVVATGRSKAELRRDIVAGTAGYRSRTAAMSGGAWAC